LDNLEPKIEEAINEFHRLFYPEAEASLVGTSKDGKLAILFTGNICLTCGMSDYFIDFLEILNGLMDEEYGIEDMRELVDEGTAWVVIYSPKRLIGKSGRPKQIIIIDPQNQEED